MDYLYENLGDERFQELCSAIVMRQNPDAQSFPVGQPDGGRDSIVYIMNPIKKEFIVFQVKFVRNPSSVKDVHKWLTSIIKQEAPKIDKLIPKGAKKFYLLTNVKGTAHLNSGSIDKVNDILESNITIPSLCWWRDDLSRIIEKDPTFKWSFPEIINGQDMLNSILFTHLNESRERRERIITSYLADQYTIDNEVKFKQIDLQNKLFDLYTDIPIHIKEINQKNRNLRPIIDIFDRAYTIIDDDYLIEQSTVNAAAFLFNPKVQEKLNKILIEGGPGQGKSTVTQFVCQVHRAKLLNKQDDLYTLPENIRNSQIKLPIKIDLRHLAMWIDKKNPYANTISKDFFEIIWKKSLESFIVSHVCHHSQSDSFNIDDLFSIIKYSSTLIVFDGFDEIADMSTRKEVVEVINRGVNRLKEQSKNIQVIITSRPAAFSDAVSFSVDEYPHFQLTDINPSTIKNYVDKWIKASKLNNREGTEIKKLVEEKIQLPHLKDLAKNPMQLAIFISLLRTRGDSLPNKRTALYDSYIELFFNRESEKSKVIRENRELIIDIHEYIAWILHSEAELYRNSGSISIEDLKHRLKEYLEKEGHETEIADQLFHVLKERVCALVSRIQGTYEFEVQPLREYFCAKFLYNTSPYSPPGGERRGTKPERFNAISKNFYWQNVLRFFAGCFDKGELPMLIHELKELQEDTYLRYTNYPSLITSHILADWVFTQYPKLLKEVVKIVIEGINLGRVFSYDKRFNNNDTIIVPEKCGRIEVFLECLNQLKSFPKHDYAFELISMMVNNPLSTDELWLTEAKKLSGYQLLRWIDYGYYLEILHKIEKSELISLLSRSNEYFDRIIEIFMRANRFDVVEADKLVKKMAINFILSKNTVPLNRKTIDNYVKFLSIITKPFIYSKLLINQESGYLFFNYLSKIFRTKEFELDKIAIKGNDEIDAKIANLQQNFVKLNTPISLWKTSITNWEILINLLANDFKSFELEITLATIAAGIKSKSEKFQELGDLSDEKISICKRARSARLKSGNVFFWKQQLSDRKLWQFKICILLSWATPKTIISLHENIAELVKTCTEGDLVLIARTLRSIAPISSYSKSQTQEILNFCKKEGLDDTLKYLISYRLPYELKQENIYKNVKRVPTSLRTNFVNSKLNFLTRKFIKNLDSNDLQEIKKLYSEIDEVEINYFGYYHNKVPNIPLDLAQYIMENPKSYPREIVILAERTCKNHAIENAVPVGKISKDMEWFS